MHFSLCRKLSYSNTIMIIQGRFKCVIDQQFILALQHCYICISYDFNQHLLVSNVFSNCEKFFKNVIVILSILRENFTVISSSIVVTIDIPFMFYENSTGS